MAVAGVENPSDHKYGEHVRFAERVMREAGGIALYYAEHSRIPSDGMSDDITMTGVGRCMNELVARRCRKAYPDVTLIDEIRDMNDTGVDEAWVFGPSPTGDALGVESGGTNCLAYVCAGEPVVGVVYNSANSCMYSAIKGEGVWLNGQPLAQRLATPYPLVSVEWGSDGELDLTFLYRRLFRQKYQAPPYTNTALTAIKTAENLMAGVVYAGKMPWDMAAAKTIAEAAGCKVTDIDGNDQCYDRAIKGAIIARPDFHRQLLAMVRSARREAAAYAGVSRI